MSDVRTGLQVLGVRTRSGLDVGGHTRYTRDAYPVLYAVTRPVNSATRPARRGHRDSRGAQAAATGPGRIRGRVTGSRPRWAPRTGRRRGVRSRRLTR